MDDIEQEIAAAVAAEQAKLAAGESSKTSTPINLKLGDTNLTFNNEQELSDRVNGFLQKQQSELELARTALAQREAALAQSQQTQPQKFGQHVDPTKEDLNKEFLETFVNDPYKAQQMAFEKSPYAQQVKALTDQVEFLRRKAAVSTFKETHDDYVATPENAKAIGELLDYHKLPLTEENLDLVYHDGLRRGMIKNELPASIPGYLDSEFYPPPQRRSGPPVIGRTTHAPAPNYMDGVENMSTDAIQALINKIESKR